ncbi:MAG: site-specific integrase [Magnetococcales bacterium]|nr:site-specific integrase [Magnetococcales bacterium]
MATIHKLPSGHWRVLIRKKGYPVVSRTFPKRKDAQAFVANAEDSMNRGIFVDRSASETITIRDAFDRYLKSVSLQKAPNTHRDEINRANNICRYIGEYTLATLKAPILAKFRDRRVGEGKSGNTIRLDFALIRHLYRIAIREWGIGLEVNPVDLVDKPGLAPGRDRRLVQDEEARLLAACDAYVNPMLGWIVRIALETAMRQGEILRLRVQDIDLVNRLASIPPNKTKARNKPERVVPLTREAVRVFGVAVNWIFRPTDSDLVFPGDPGKDGVRRPYTLTKPWQTVLKRAGVEGFHFHDLRHEAVSRLVESGLSDQEVAAISGHQTMQMLRRYTHLRPRDLVMRLDAIRK